MILYRAKTMQGCLVDLPQEKLPLWSICRPLRNFLTHPSRSYASFDSPSHDISFWRPCNIPNNCFASSHMHQVKRNDVSKDLFCKPWHIHSREDHLTPCFEIPWTKQIFWRASRRSGNGTRSPSAIGSSVASNRFTKWTVRASFVCSLSLELVLAWMGHCTNTF